MTHDNIDILVVDDDISHCTILQALLRGWGYNVALANSGQQALAQVREQVFDLVLCDVRMAEMDGIATLKEIKALNPAIPVLIMTAYSSVETAVEALKTGALDYLIKPLDFDNLQATLEKALAHMHSIDAETPAVSASQFGMVGKSPAMQHLLSEIALVAPSEATVLIHGDCWNLNCSVTKKGRLLEPTNGGKGALLRRTAARCFSMKLAISRR